MSNGNEKEKTANFSTEPEIERDKATRLFLYLKELCALRTTQTRNTESYDQVFWINEIPRHKLCNCAFWQLIDQSTSDQYFDPWIEIRKPALKSPPELPDELEPWIKMEDLFNSTLSEPRFNEQIPLSIMQSDSDNIDPNAFISLKDHPQILNMFAKYFEVKWKPWANEDRELQEVHKAYNRIFNIYQRQEKLGEQYEVVLGIGLLLWKSLSSGEIKRHILVIQGHIEFDRHRGVISVGPSIDSPQSTLECSMLEPTDRPNPKDLTEIEEELKILNDDPWDATNLKRVLEGFANAIPVAGDFSPSFLHTSGMSEKPVIRLAPALILRKRNLRSFEEFYQQIINQIMEGAEIPENIRRIINIVDDSSKDGITEENNETNLTSSISSDNEIYFPLPANNQQKQIIQKIKHSRGVIVQGPPGTGKSHTICNLIAHFLASGMRVLVTSETPRALEVLRHKLHKELSEIEELCVVWLGSGPESQKTLEYSVRGIIRRKANWNFEKGKNQIIIETKQLDEARKEQAKLHQDLRACREIDVYQHSKVNGRFSGTLQQIAIQLNQERIRFNWFIDKPKNEDKLTISSQELLKMAQIKLELTPELIKQLGYRLFPIDQLILPNEFSRYVNAEKKIDLEYKKTNHSRNYPGYSKLCTLNREKRDILKLKIEEVLLIQDALSKHLYPWAEKVSREISGGQIQSWKNILDSTIEQVDIIDRLQKEIGNVNILGLEGKNLQVVGDHANALKKHLENGKRLGFGPFRVRVVKEGLYLVKLVKVNGKNCTSIPILKQLISWIQISIRSKKLADIWKNITAPPIGDVSQQCPTYRDRCELIKHAMLIHDRIEDARKTLSDCPGIYLPAWHKQGEVQAFLNAIDALNVEDDFKVAQHIFESLTESLAIFTNSGNFHPTTEQIKEAITNRDIALYNSTYESSVYLNSNANSLAFFSEVIKRFNKFAPKTCKNYNESYSNSEWNNRFTEFESAWSWAKTDCWLVEMSDKERPDRIRQELEKSIKSEKNALKSLAAAKAWQFCMSNMGEKERMDLVAWENAIKKIRGGHGKKVEFWREEARERMEGCRKSIPAWIMPLYQVVQTVRVKQFAFDVAIIDEASQSGPNGIFLRYIADKIIVVGDDEQITPVYVGVELAQADYLLRKYLFDIPYASELLPVRENSLFSEAKLRFGDPLLLTEHFRCMPEIIQFSNNISYVKDHLIPLRQYGVDRLEPVRSVFIENGYRKGSSESIENPPEAEALAAQIAECCEDPAYSGKTFGVISLMGSKQAELINSLLLKEIGAEKMEERRLICGRPYDFQGDERDVIFLTMVDAPQDGKDCHKMSDPDTRRRFNVAASRARDQLWLFHSASLNNLNPSCYRYRLLQYCMNPTVMQPEEIGETTITELRRISHDPSRRKPGKISGTPFESWFEVDVFLKIIDRGYRVLPQFSVNERRIDLVVEGLRGRLAVECDGDESHMDRWEDDQIRQKELERYGWTFWRVRGGDYYRDPDKALEELWETLEKLKITPRYKWESEKDQSKKQETSDNYTSGEYNEADEAEDIEKETIEDVSEHKTEKGFQIKRDETDRLDRVLEYTKTLKKKPEETPPYDIQNAILKLLKKCPNHSCTLKSLTSRVLKELGLATRGNPRLEFEKRVMRNLSVLWRKGYIMEYKAKNKRVKLVDLSINIS